jgi:hypothetical protein
MAKINKDFVDKLVKKAIKFVEPLEDARATYTPTSKSALVRQRIETRLAALTPEIVPAVLFEPASGYVGQAIAFAGYWRKFRIEVANFGAAETGRGANSSPYELAITIEVGYPSEATINVAGVIYEVADIKSHDDEQIDKLIKGGDLFTNPTTIGDARVVSLQSGFDPGNTFRRHRYIFQIKRSWL